MSPASIGEFPIMHFFVYFNSTQAELDGSWRIHAGITIFEAAGIFISYPCLAFVLYLLNKSKSLHFNLRMIWNFLGFEYYTQLTSRSVEIYYMFNGSPINNGFIAASLARCMCYFIVSLLLPALVAERACASYFLVDYERKKRSWVSVVIIIPILISSVIMSIAFHLVQSTMGLHIAMLVINLIASGGMHFLERYNRMRSKKYSGKTGLPQYILSEKYQISENLRTFSILKTMTNTVTLLNLVSTVTLALDNFEMSPSTANIVVTIFNVTILIYGSTAMTVMVVCNKPWMALAGEVFRKIRKAPPKERVGVVTDPLAETNQYFSQLANDWDKNFATNKKNKK